MELTTCSTDGFYTGLPGAAMVAPTRTWR
jgi:hypothetical protein